MQRTHRRRIWRDLWTGDRSLPAFATVPLAPAILFLVGIQAVIFAPIVEETIYRGVLQPALHAKAPPSIVLVSGGVGLEPFVGGIFMGIAFWLRRSLAAATVVHAAGNLYLGVAALVYASARAHWPHCFEAM